MASRLKTIWAHYLYLREDAEIQGRYPPSTAPCYPVPGKKFMIMRTEIAAPPENMLGGFNTLGKVPSFDELTEPVSADDVLQSKPDGKKKWALLGLNKVLPFKSESKGDEDEGERGSRLPPPPPPTKTRKTPSRSASGTSTPSSEGTSRGGSPVFDAPRYIFRFVLNWYPPAAMPTVEMMLTNPRLPSPAHSWISSRGWSSGLPPAAPGLPPITRRISGSTQMGLINEARNASPLDGSEPVPGRGSFSSVFTRTTGDKSSPGSSGRPSLNLGAVDRRMSGSQGSPSSPGSHRAPGLLLEGSIQPVKPTGALSKSAVYSGRALAEWSIVVHECNTFVDRRREEGILSLGDVEVPTLTLENYRRIG